MSEVEQKEFRNVKVPLSVDQIKEFFTNKNLVYLINYHDSDLKGVVFLTYLSNLDLPAEINFTGSSFEQKEELLKIYMETRNIIACDSLRLNIAHILLENRGISTRDMIQNPCFNAEETAKFISNNKDLVNRWEEFIESSILFAQTAIPELEEKLDMKNNVPVIEDQQYVGANIVNMFSLPYFYETFLSVPNRHELKYFKFQFEEYMFRGKNFYSYYSSEENLVFHTFIAHVNGDINLELLDNAAKEAQSLLEE